MADVALKPMTLEEFLRWDDGTETHYELIGGFPVAMAPPAAAHRMLAARLVTQIETSLAARRPCNAQTDAGLIRPDRADSYFEADIAASCERHAVGQQGLVEPFLIIEILSPSTERHDRRVKLPAYRLIPSVQEIVLIDSDGMYAEVHRRSAAQWIIEIVRGRDAMLSLASVPVEARMVDLYEGVQLPDPEE